MRDKTAFGAALGAIAMACAGLTAGDALAAIDYIDAVPSSGHVVVDVRLEVQCVPATLAGARCLPMVDIVGPHGRLPNISGLLWLFGTLGLDGREHVVVAGHKNRDREVVAGLLYLAGQQRVSVLKPAVIEAVTAGAATTPGQLRNRTRTAVYQSPMRADRIVLRSELAALIASADPPLLIDGRTDAEYWGETIRARRGGHVPGAQSSPLGTWRIADGAPPPLHVAAGSRPVVYGHDSIESLVLFARMTAVGFDPRLLMDGWVGWAADGALPADSVTYPERTPEPGTPRAAGAPLSPLQGSALVLLIAFACAAAGYILGRRNADVARTS